MNILAVANIAPFQVGGAEIQVRKLAENWLSQGHTVTIAGNRIPFCTLQAEKSYNKFHCIHIPTVNTNKFTRAISYGLALSWFILKNKNKIDIIYCRFLYDASIIISILKIFHLISIPLISCPACSGKEGDVYYLQKLPATNILIHILNKGCDAINIISPQIEKELIQVGIDRERFSYIPNGVTIYNQSATQHISKITYHDNDKSFIFVGRITKQKGVNFLIKAWKRLAEKKYFPWLTIVGDGPDRIELERLTKELQLNKKIVFLGLVEHYEIHHLLTSHDIFILPSISEGHPNALLEAMAAGLPSIVTKCGGSEYFIDNSMGRITSPGNVEDLVRSILEMLSMSNEQLCKMGKKAQKCVKKKYAIEAVATKHIDLFKKKI